MDIFTDSDICRTVRETIEHKLPSARMEAMLDLSGGRVWFGYNTAVLTDRHGIALGAILSFSDLTEVKRLQEQMELKERLTALGEMSAGIAHELRNPMAVISGYVNLLGKKTDEERQNIIRDITAEIQGMNRIIGDLLTFARPASLNRVRVNVKEMIEGCLASVLHAASAEASIKTVLRLDNITAYVDEVLMRQALGNLIQNAVEAMTGGGALTVTMHADRELSIIIGDTGPGIPPEHIKKVFLPFFTTKDTGVGMGLALTHKVVTAHGGRISVVNREGGGASFRFTIPLEGQPPSMLGAAGPPGETS